MKVKSRCSHTAARVMFSALQALVRPKTQNGGAPKVWAAAERPPEEGFRRKVLRDAAAEVHTMTCTAEEMRARGAVMVPIQEWPAPEKGSQDLQVGNYMIFGANRGPSSRRRGVVAFARRGRAVSSQVAARPQSWRSYRALCSCALAGRSRADAIARCASACNTSLASSRSQNSWRARAWSRCAAGGGGWGGGA